MSKNKKASKSNGANSVSGIVIFLVLIASFFYYKTYSKKVKEESKSKKITLTATKLQNSASLNVSDPALSGKKIRLLKMYEESEPSEHLLKTKTHLESYFQSAGLDLEVVLANYLDPNIIKLASEADFTLRPFVGYLKLENVKNNLFEPILVSNDCKVRSRVIVNRNSTFKTLKDLDNKIIVIFYKLLINPMTVDYLLSLPIKEPQVLNSDKYTFVLDLMTNDKIDALVISEKSFKENKDSSDKKSSEEFNQKYRELDRDQRELPCLGIFASVKLNKVLVEKFSKLFQEFYKNTLMRKVEKDEFSKLIESLNWLAIDSMMEKMKPVPRTFPVMPEEFKQEVPPVLN